MDALRLTKILVCPICDYVGDDVSKVIEAVRSAGLSGELKCPRCSASIPVDSFASHLASHVKVSGKNWTCEVCNEKFGNRGSFLRHARSHLVLGVPRDGAYVWECLVCGSEFFGKNAALVHVLKRHGKRST